MRGAPSGRTRAQRALLTESLSGDRMPKREEDGPLGSEACGSGGCVTAASARASAAVGARQRGRHSATAGTPAGGSGGVDSTRKALRRTV
jgi:hypothetical protein